MACQSIRPYPAIYVRCWPRLLQGQERSAAVWLEEGACEANWVRAAIFPVVGLVLVAVMAEPASGYARI